MTRTPDEIKKGLECCKEDECFGDRENCPYTADPKLCVGVMCADALALIQQLEAQVPRWISVEERLPEDMDDVLTWVGGLVEVGCYDESNECWELYTYVGDGSVTHWMPLPEPPEESP